MYTLLSRWSLSLLFVIFAAACTGQSPHATERIWDDAAVADMANRDAGAVVPILNDVVQVAGATGSLATTTRTHTVQPAVAVPHATQEPPATAQESQDVEAANTPHAAIEGQGALRAVSMTGEDLGNCPLRHTRVEMEISGFVTRARVTQRFENHFTHRIEAIYTFPLPEDGAVRDFEMRTGTRVIRGLIQRREEARANYEQARERGETASLLEQERPNIFTQSVANIEPGQAIEVTLEYVDTLDYETGTYSLAFPMTVGPRFSPQSVDDAARIAPPIAVGTRAGHDIDVDVRIDAGVPIRGLRSASHQVVTTVTGSRAHVTLAAGDTIPNRDFVLSYDVAPERLASGVLTTRQGADGYLSLVVQPSLHPVAADVRAREVIFVLDTSGSMQGAPMEKSKALMNRLLSTMRPNDAFNVLTFDDTVSTLSVAPLPATSQNLARGRAFVAALEGGGGTNMMNGIHAALDMSHDASRLKIIVFLTDGYIGNEQEVFRQVASSIGQSRLFSFGVGCSVNRYLLDGLASRGRGEVAYALLNSPEEDVVNRFADRLDKPMLTDVTLDWGGLHVTDVSSDPVPDLFAGKPLVVHARYTQAGAGVVTLRGRLGGQPYAERINVTLPERETANAALESVWARKQVDRYMDEIDFVGETAELTEPIVELALAHRLLTKYTSFVAIEERTVANAAGAPETVIVPVELPEGVSAEGIFGPAASMSLSRFQPGDPEVRVVAPAGSQAVSVIFPFGETRAAEYDNFEQRWTTRFLVPRGTPDGVYEILILVTQQDGSIVRHSISYTVDSHAPEVDLDIETAVPGVPVRLYAVQRLTTHEFDLMPGTMEGVASGRIRAELVSDVAHVTVRMPNNDVISMEHDGTTDFLATWTVPESMLPGTYVMQVISVDISGNRREAEMPFVVSPR